MQPHSLRCGVMSVAVCPVSCAACVLCYCMLSVRDPDVAVRNRTHALVELLVSVQLQCRDGTHHVPASLVPSSAQHRHTSRFDDKTHLLCSFLVQPHS